MRLRLKNLFKIIPAMVLSLAVGTGTISAAAADPIQQTTQPTSNLTIHVLQQNDKKEQGMDGSGLAGQTVPGSTSPLAGVTVIIQRVTYLDTDTNNYETTGEPITTTSDSDGLAKFEEVPNGRYIVKYSNLPQNVRTQIKDHFVDLPGRNQDGTGWNYDVHVYPKMETVYGSVILTKYGNDGTTPLSGARFRLYVKGNDGAYTKEYADASGKKTEFVTNEAGQIAVSALPDGSYAFIETGTPEGYAIDTTPVPFTVTESGTVAENNGVYEKESGVVYKVTHRNYEIPEIHKGVRSVVNQHSGYDIDDLSTWVISPTVPADIERYTKFIVTDKVNGMDDRLKFAGTDTLNVVVSDKDLSDTKFDAADLSGYTILKKGTDYQAEYDSKTETFRVIFVDGSFTAGRTGIKNKYVYIVFGCQFDNKDFHADEIMGDAIYNQASLIYNNSFMKEDDVLVTETPEIHTGGVVGYKYFNNATKQALAGAEFKLAYTKEDALNGIYVKDAQGNDLLATSDENGIFRFSGIAYGEDGVKNETAQTEYWLVETKAPDGYLLLGQPISFVADHTSHRYETVPTLQIENVKKAELPTTGGIGTWPFVIGGGICLTAVAGLAVYLIATRKKAEK